MISSNYNAMRLEIKKKTERYKSLEAKQYATKQPMGY